MNVDEGTSVIRQPLSGHRSHLSLVVTSLAPFLNARPWVLLVPESNRYSFQGQAMSDRTPRGKTLWVPDRRTLDEPVCEFGARGICKEAQALRLTSVYFIFTFNLYLNGSNPQGLVAAIRGSFEGFPASSRWKRYLFRKHILERSLSSFSWYFPISNGTELANLGGVQVGAVQALFWRNEI